MRATRYLLLFALTAVLAFTPAMDAQNKDKDKDKDKDKEHKSGEVSGKRLSQWIGDLKSSDPATRQMAIRAVAAFGVDAKDVGVPALIACLRDPDAAIRTDAAQALANLASLQKGINPEDIPKLVPALSNLLTAAESQRAVRLQAIWALSRLGPKAKPALTQLCDITVARDSSSFEVRYAVAVALGQIGADPPRLPDSKATACLIGSLNDSCAQVRLAAIMSLSALGLPPSSADLEREKSSLKGMLNDRERVVAVWARVLLMFIDKNYANDANLKALVKYIQSDPDPRVRSAAIQGIGTLYNNKELLPALAERVGDLLSGLRDRELNVILTTIATIGSLGENAGSSAADALASYLVDPEIQVRIQAAHSMGNLGNLAKSHIPKLVEVLIKERDSKDTTLTLTVLSSLVQLGAVSEPALSHLRDMAANHKDEGVRKAATETIKLVSDKLKKQ